MDLMQQGIWYFKYCKLVEAFHNVNECKTAVYFGWWLPLQFMRPDDFDRLPFGVASLQTDWELHLATETEQDCTRLSVLQYDFKYLNHFMKPIMKPVWNPNLVERRIEVSMNKRRRRKKMLKWNRNKFLTFFSFKLIKSLMYFMQILGLTEILI